MDPKDYPRRYLHIVGAFGAGGRHKIHPELDHYLSLPAIAPVHLPMAGGTSEAKARRVSVDGKKIEAGQIDKKLLRQLRAKEYLSVGSAYSLAETGPVTPGQPFTSRTVSEVKAVKVADGISLKYALLNLEMSHDPDKTRNPHVTFGKTEITGLKLGKSEIKITLDLATFNKYPTLEAFEEAFRKNPKLRKDLSKRFVTDPVTGELHRNPSGYVVGSIVKKIEGLPADAKVEGGYMIVSPKFGRIVLGEILMGPYVRRVTLVRLGHQCSEYGSGCSGGSTYP